MNGYGPSPFPTLEMATCRTGPDGNLELDRAQAITPPQAVTSWVEGLLRPWASKGVNEAEAVGVEDNEVYERLPPTPKLTVVPASCMAPLWPSFSACCCSYASRIVSGRHAAERNASGCASVRRPSTLRHSC